MPPEDIIIELMPSGEKDSSQAQEFVAAAASSGPGELFWLVIAFLWALASVLKLLSAERQSQRNSAWLWAGSYAAASLVGALLFCGLLSS